VIEAVVFDLDGVLLQSEELWDEVRMELARERGGTYGPEQQRAMMGMSSIEGRRRVYPPAPHAHAARPR
jgi:beta-phosphoglucomutase-like phosphatase (HAD superfamily)